MVNCVTVPVVLLSVVIVALVPTKEVVFNLVIVPTPEILRFLPLTSSYVMSSRTNKSPPT